MGGSRVPSAMATLSRAAALTFDGRSITLKTAESRAEEVSQSILPEPSGKCTARQHAGRVSEYPALPSREYSISAAQRFFRNLGKVAFLNFILHPLAPSSRHPPLRFLHPSLLMPVRRYLFTRWLPLLCWMALIFKGSSDVLSGAHTSRFFVPFMHWLFGQHLSLEQIDYAHLLFRKCGHVTEYAVLCVLFWRALRSLPRFNPVHASGYWGLNQLAVLLSAAYAATDEFHQSFVPSRTASIHDVVIDTVGAALGLGFYLLISRRFRPGNGGGNGTPT